MAPEALTRTTPPLGEVFAAPVHREERCIELGSTGRHENVAIEGMEGDTSTDGCHGRGSENDCQVEA